MRFHLQLMIFVSEAKRIPQQNTGKSNALSRMNGRQLTFIVQKCQSLMLNRQIGTSNAALSEGRAPTLDIFQDCLDLKTNDAFKSQVAKEIAARDVFLLFWSRHASAFQTAQVKPGLNAILPMPLEDRAIAPLPPEFVDKHLHDRFMQTL